MNFPLYTDAGGFGLREATHSHRCANVHLQSSIHTSISFGAPFFPQTFVRGPLADVTFKSKFAYVHVKTIKFPIQPFRLPIFLYIKPPDEQTLARLIPDDIVWTNAMDSSKQTYEERCQQLTACTDTLYTLQKRLVEKLLINTDGTDRLPSSRMIFINKLRRYVLECSVENRTFELSDRRHPVATQPAIALSLLCILLDILKTTFAMECPDDGVFIPPKAFYDGSLQYYRFDRIGGVLSHLKRLYRDDLAQRLGLHNESTENENDEILRDTIELSDICKDSSKLYKKYFFFDNIFWFLNMLISHNQITDSAMFLLGNHPRGSMSAFRAVRQTDDFMETLHSLTTGDRPFVPTAFDIQAKSGNITSRESLTYLMDSCILYYYAVGHKYTIMVGLSVMFTTSFHIF